MNKIKLLALELVAKWKAYKFGFYEAFTAVGYVIIVGAIVYGLAALLGGCASTTVGVKYTHDSSIPDYRDHNESNMAGPYVRFLACPRGRDNVYCPEVEVSAEWEFHTPYPHTYGTNPTGQIEIRQPIFVKK